MQYNSIYSAFSIYRGYFSLQKSWKTTKYLTREGEVWVPLVNTTPYQSINIVIIVLSALSCYMRPRYVESQ